MSPVGRALLALFVGLVELSQLMIGRLGLKGGVFDAIGGLNFGSLGFVIVGAFVVTWAEAFAIFKVRRVEERWGEMVAGSELPVRATPTVQWPDAFRASAPSRSARISALNHRTKITIAPNR